MNLIYYKSEKGNFGDDLNLWLWPQIFGENFLKEDLDIAFFGIGSILIEDSKFIEMANQHKTKIIFGTGVRSINEHLQLDDSWKLLFVRGPYSSLKITGDIQHYIADGAYYISLLPQYEKYLSTPKKYKVSFIPYFQSVDKVDWKSICEEMSWNLILPTDTSVEDFIMEVAASEQVISEAMHGTMIADIMRVPWKRLRFYAHQYEGEKVSEWKWNDWLLSIGISENTFINAPIRKNKFIYRMLPFLFKRKNKRLILQKAKEDLKLPYKLSSNSKLENIKGQLRSKKEELLSFKN